MVSWWKEGAILDLPLNLNLLKVWLSNKIQLGVYSAGQFSRLPKGGWANGYLTSAYTTVMFWKIICTSCHYLTIVTLANPFDTYTKCV